MRAPVLARRRSRSRVDGGARPGVIPAARPETTRLAARSASASSGSEAVDTGPDARAAGRVDPRLHRHAGAQPVDQPLAGIDADTNRDPLRHLGEVAGGIVGPQHRELATRRRRDALHPAGQGQLVGQGAGRADLAALVRSGHPELTAWTRDAAAKLAPMIAMLENLFDPESIILGGSLPVALLDALNEAMHPLPISVASRRQRSATLSGRIEPVPR